MQADVFCRVIDNYGDIGVTWRLVRQLQREHGWQIRLWVDDLKSFQRLEPQIALAAQQDLNGIEVIDWTQAADFTPRPVVIATFSCDLPEPYIENLRAQATVSTSTSLNPASPGTPKTLWINLEYLSAEDWVEGCHQLPSLRSDGLSSHFFFPGFTAQTGGLLRESDLIAQRDAWQADRAGQRVFLENLGLSQAAITALFPVTANAPAARLVNLFCYENSPVAALIGMLGADTQQTVLLIPEGIHPEYQSGQYGQLRIERVPFLPQTEYDKILWTADLNFVRGEDSIIRGIWAGKPLIWQIYPQTENTHLEKLQAWLARTGLPDDICRLMMCWNPESAESDSEKVENLTSPAKQAQKINLTGYKNTLHIHNKGEPGLSADEFARAMQQHLQPANFHIWQQHARRFSDGQASLPDLAATLTTFCVNKAILLQKG
jgi:uncharacterized repeat protein (TIGR03837 family)